jgi:spermidine dehydrogenase
MSDVSRRDFLNGVALAIAAGLTPAAQIAAQPLRYPPALTGLRGQHPGSFEDAHVLRDGKRFAIALSGALTTDYRPILSLHGSREWAASRHSD